jgi:hypothetical protein
MKIIIITNSSYSYLWPILNDKLNKCKNIFICLDSNPNQFIFNENFSLINYDANLNYSKRVKSILEKIDDDYIVLLHDIDIILNFDNEMLEKYLSIVKENNIDRLSFGVYNNPNKIIQKNNLVVCKLDLRISNNFFTPFDHTPSIYNRKSLIELYTIFNEESYVSVEQNLNVQIYVNENYKFYGIQKTNDIILKYHRGFVFSEFFNFLHITVQGKFLPKNLYYDLIEDFEKIINDYELTNISYHDDSLFIQKNEL